MSANQSILISIRGKHLDNILEGKKKVELRRRILHLLPGTVMWIYCPRPVAQILAVAKISRIVSAHPARIWSEYGEMSGVARAEFDCYFRASETACAIFLSEVQRLETPVSLSKIKKTAKNFHPPQFFKKLSSTCPELQLFESCNLSNIISIN